MKEQTKLKLLHIFFPNKCPSCHKAISSQMLFCEKCESDFVYPLGERCEVCFNKKEYCDCAKRPKFYFRSITPFLYKNSAKNALITLKVLKNKRVAKFFAQNIVLAFDKKYSNVKIDAVIPVPLFKERQKQRGFNQSELIAEEIAKIKGVPFNNNCLKQVEKSKTQHLLNFKQRFENVKGIYKANGIPIECQTVLLVDDIMTSGATLNECAKMLRLEGVSKIYCVAAAKSE